MRRIGSRSWPRALGGLFGGFARRCSGGFLEAIVIGLKLGQERKEIYKGLRN